MFWDEEIKKAHGGTMPEITIMAKCNEMGCKLLFPNQRIGKAEQRHVRAFTLANLSVFRKFLEPKIKNCTTKQEYMEWMIDDGAAACLESLARGVRSAKKRHNSDPSVPYEPYWYDVYLVSKRWHSVRLQSHEFFRDHRRLHCQLNRKHRPNEYHHTSYENLGTDKEWEDLIPLCNSCHEMIRKCGPRLPSTPPEALVQKLKEEGMVIS